MQLIAGVPRFMEHPLVAPLIALASAGAAKTGYGVWGIGALLGFMSLYFSLYFGAAVTAAANRSLARWIDRLPRYEATRTAR